MNAEFKRKWVEALRSGDFQQTTGRLRDGNGYCCIGVACHLIDPDRWREHFGVALRWGHATGAMLTDDRIRVGLSSNDEDTLIALNDDGNSFSEIADWIEKNL